MMSHCCILAQTGLPPLIRLVQVMDDFMLAPLSLPPLALARLKKLIASRCPVIPPYSGSTSKVSGTM